MQIVQNKALQLKVKDPQRILSVIPKSAVLHQGEKVSHVLVKWGLDEARVLANLGVKNVPSPIVGQYHWPGMYKPFAHQRETAAFLTMNPRAYCFNEQGCFDASTEYLTPTGWKRFDAYTDGDQVAQYHPDTGAIEFVDPIEYVKLPCTQMLRVKTKYGLDQLLSPEHRVLLTRYNRPEATEVISAQALKDRQDAYMNGERGRHYSGQIGWSNACIPTTFTAPETQGLGLTDAELRVQVALIADGHFRSKSTNRCVVRFRRARKIDRMTALLDSAGIEYRRSFTAGYTVFTFQAPRREKEFGPDWWSATPAQLAVVADEVMYWDGSVSPNPNRGPRFSTTSKQSADFVQYAIASQGHTARITTDSRPYRDGKLCYNIQVQQHRRMVGVGGRGEPGSVRPSITWEESPDGFKYCFMVPSTFLLVRRNGCIAASGNTGKTLATAWAADYLMKLRIVKRVLIICPVSTMQSAWQADLFKSLMHRTVGVAYGDKRKRAEVINSNAEFVIINPDGVGVVARELRQAKFDLIVIDEATCIKNANTTRWKNINSLITPSTWLWMLTGTPASQSPLDAYGLARMMNPRTAPRSFTAWRDEVMYKATLFKWTPKDGWKERVFQLLQPAIRFTKDECLDLPPKTYVTRDVPLSKSQQDAYEKLRTQLAIHTAGETITAVNAAAGMSKLLQCSAGAVYSDGQETVDFDITPRYKVLLDIIDETDHKVLVFVPFTNTVDRITEMLNADGIPTEFIDGRVAAGKRNDIIQRFQLQNDTRVLVLQPQAVSHGITLHAANVSVWWGPVASQETYAQANDRMHRAGQKNPCTVINLQGSQAERIRYRALQSMANDQHELLSMYKEMLAS